ncbi:50S ribosomal protein L31 [Candidatus Daviesbacteria bacterium]|nr:50S ribosomal protein L31 [Candidatus Daviesbacteria bacterium]
MKQGIHPNWFRETKVTCACGNSFITGSTLAEIRVEICSKCHPLFTGSQKFVDTLGQVEKFSQKVKKSEERSELKKQILQARAAKTQKQTIDKPTLKDLLMQARKDLHS